MTSPLIEQEIVLSPVQQKNRRRNVKKNSDIAESVKRAAEVIRSTRYSIGGDSDKIAQALAAAGLLVTDEPCGMCDGKGVVSECDFDDDDLWETDDCYFQCPRCLGNTLTDEQARLIRLGKAVVECEARAGSVWLDGQEYRDADVLLLAIYLLDAIYAEANR